MPNPFFQDKNQMKLDFCKKQTTEEVFGLNPRAAHSVEMKPFKV